MIQEILDFFNPLQYLYIWLISTFVLAFFVSWSSYPAIFKVARDKHLMDEPNARSIHSRKTPTLGGIGIFLSLVVVITTFGGLLDTKLLLLLLGGLTILFFLGLKDDLLILSPKKKFLGQLLAALVLIVFTDTRIVGFFGIFGIDVLPYWVSVLFTLFVYILIINAYNLIDGVDGLAGTLALFASGAFAYIFLQTKDVNMATMAVAMIGALLPFLRWNFSKKNKIFMGDTGSMIIGFLIAFFTVRFLSEAQGLRGLSINNAAPILVLSILFFPLLDTFRIFFIRLVIHKKSPFEADKNHLHHRFLQFGLTHRQTTGLIVILNMVLFIITLFFQQLEIHLQILLLFGLGTFIYSTFFIFHWIIRGKSSAKIVEQLQ